MQKFEIDVASLKRARTSSRPRQMLLFVLPYFVGKVDALGVKTRSYLAFPYGPLTIATYVERNSATGSSVVIEDLNLVPEGEDLVDYASRRATEVTFDYIGFSFMFDSSLQHMHHLSSQLRKVLPGVLQLVGGAAATTGAAEILSDLTTIDAVCYSEGELAITRLLDSEDPWIELFKDPWIIRKNSSRKANAVYVDSLDEVIDLDYRHVQVDRYSMKESFSPFASYRYEKDVKQFFLVTSRGCPFKCTFCAEPALHGANMRYASVDRIISHVASLQDRYGLNVLTLYDDQLLIDVPRAKELFSRLAQFKLRIEMPNGVTAVFIDEELAQLMKAAGVDTIALAIESGSDYVLRHIIKKPLRIPKLYRVMKALRSAQIFVQGFFVIGMPGETDDHRRETLDLIRDIDLDWASFSVAGPVRGSQLYEDAKQNGWLPKEYSVGKFVSNSAVLNIPGYDNVKIMEQAVEFNVISNFVNSRALRIGDFFTARRLFMEVSERANQHAIAHLFLSFAESKLGLFEVSRGNYDKALEIISQDSSWARLVDKYDLLERCST